MWPRTPSFVLGLVLVTVIAVLGACGEVAQVQFSTPTPVQGNEPAASPTATTMPAPEVEATAAVEAEATVQVSTSPTPTPRTEPSPTAVSRSEEPSPASPSPVATPSRPVSPSPTPVPSEVSREDVPATPTPVADLALSLRFKFEGAVVYIETPDSSGSGFLYDTEGWIVTNAHVVGENSEVTVFLKGSQHIARVTGVNELVDVAVLKVDSSADLSVVSFGNTGVVAVGDQVVAMGYANNTRSSVDLSTWAGKVVTFSRGSSVDYLQTDAVVGPLGTGGPLFNARGEVIGLSTTQYDYAPGTSVQSGGLAISINLVKAVLPALEEGRSVRVTPTPTASPEPLPWRTYENGILRFTISIAPDWAVDESPEFGIAIYRLDNAAKLEITSAAQTRFSLDQFEDDEIAFRTNEVRGYLGTFELVSSERVALGQDREAVHLVYRYRDTLNFCDTYYSEYLVLAGGYEYILLGSMCEAKTDLHQPELEDMLRSFIALR